MKTLNKFFPVFFMGTVVALILGFIFMVHEKPAFNITHIAALSNAVSPAFFNTNIKQLKEMEKNNTPELTIKIDESNNIFTASFATKKSFFSFNEKCENILWRYLNRTDQQNIEPFQINNELFPLLKMKQENVQFICDSKENRLLFTYLLKAYDIDGKEKFDETINDMSQNELSR